MGKTRKSRGEAGEDPDEYFCYKYLLMAEPRSKDTPRITPEEYLARERASIDQKHEYVDGEIFAMVGASPAHNLIMVNIVSELARQLKNSPCRTVTSDLKVRNEAKDSFFYPDVAVICGKFEVHDDTRDVVTNPRVVIEILSPSTETYDRSEKFFRYQQIASLTDYILVAQDKARIEHLSRQGNGQWLLTISDGLDAAVTISSINCTLFLSEVYNRVWEE